MPPLAVVTADLLVRPRPVLCLDTCDLLDIIQCVAEGNSQRLASVRRLLDALTLNPDRLQLVVTYLVGLEWQQNQATIIDQAERKTREVDEAIAELQLAGQHARARLPGPPPRYAGAGLPAAVAALADAVLTQAVTLDRDDPSVGRALDRVYNRRRPSHAGMVKDSIHLEHYLELSRQLQAAGFASRRLFVSSNRADFWEAKNRADIHQDLAPELAAVGLEFFGALDAALGSLRIWGGSGEKPNGIRPGGASRRRSASDDQQSRGSTPPVLAVPSASLRGARATLSAATRPRAGGKPARRVGGARSLSARRVPLAAWRTVAPPAPARSLLRAGCSASAFHH